MTRISITLLSVLFISCQTSQRTQSPESSKPVKVERAEVEKPKPALQAVEMPKIGLILGPGGFKSFAHLGVLREFEKIGLKVHAVTGLEWGAVVGAIYSMKGRANDLEWQLFKLKKSDLPRDAKFGAAFEPMSVQSLSKYLETVFQQSKIEDGSIKFACSSMLLKNGKTAWWDQGPIKPAIEKCLSFPPMYSAWNGWVADAFGTIEAAKKLREMGAEIIVFVNVLARGNILKESRAKDQDQTEIIWWQGSNQLNSNLSGIDWVIGVHTRNYDILDYEARQSFVLFGQEFGAAAAKKMAEQYGL